MRLTTTPRRTLAILAALALYARQPAWAWVDPAAGTPYPHEVARPASIPDQNWKPGHRGVDLPLRIGAPVLAAGDGVITFAGSVAGAPVVTVEHASGIRTTYQPVHTNLPVGTKVREGEAIGVLARSSTRFAGEHVGLHWGALTGPNKYIDPLTLLEPPRIRLKPVDAPGRRRS